MSETQKTLGIVGGGLAGIAAAETAATREYKTVLFERAAILGGRGTSILEPVQQQWIDTGQHLILGCCTEVLSLNQRLGLDRFFVKSSTIPFVTYKQQHWSLTASPFLPKRWQLLPSFLSMPFLPLGERYKTGLLLQRLCSESLPNITMSEWFKKYQVSATALEAFWLPLILSTLCDLPDYVAAKAVQKVIRHGFFSGQEGMSVYLPIVPLRSIYHDAASQKLAEQNVEIQFFKRLRRLHWKKTSSDSLPTITALEFSDRTVEQFDRYVLAIPAFQLWKVLEASDLSFCVRQLGFERFEPGAITTVHLWLDRPVLKAGQRYSMLSGGIGQFLCVPTHDENYYTVVISAAHRLLSEKEMTVSGRKDLAEKVLAQLRTTFRIPALQLQHYRTTTCFDAVFSPKPVLYDCRPESKALFTNGTIAGDWTQTGYPATLEGAVRSGLTAAAEQ